MLFSIAVFVVPSESCFLGLSMLSLEVLLLPNALAGLRNVNLHAQVSRQAQHFVDLGGAVITLQTLRCRFRRTRSAL